MRWTKLTNIVEFPTGTAELDLTPYGADSMEDKDPAPIYSLYGVSNHMGMIKLIVDNSCNLLNNICFHCRIDSWRTLCCFMQTSHHEKVVRV